MREIIIHPGMSKAGSSSLQHSAVVNKEILISKGVYYPTEIYEIDYSILDSGNAQILYLLFVESSTNSQLFVENTLKLIEKWFLEASQHGCSKIFISTENFALIEINFLKLLLRRFCEIGIVYRFAVVIRNPYEWHFSSWVQGVKVQANSSWISDSLRSCGDAKLNLKMLILVEYLLNFEAENISIIRYEVSKHNLFSQVVSTFVELSNESSEVKEEDRLINKSLEKLEAVAIFVANNCSGSNILFNRRLRIFLNKILQDFSLNKIREKFYFEDRETIELLVEFLVLYCPRLYEIYSDELNEILLRSQPIRLEDLLKDLTGTEALLVESVSWMAGYQKEIVSDFVMLANHKVDFYKSSPYREQVPSEFDVYYYLIENTDVLFEEIDPYFHYVQYGRKEGRSPRLL